MKKYRNQRHGWWVLLLFLCLPFKGCDLPPVEEDPEEDIANIESSLDETVAHFGELNDGAFFSFLRSFSGLNNGEMESAEWVEGMLTALEEHIDFESIENSRRFDEPAHRGLYEWNSGTGEWIARFSNQVVLVFPSSEVAPANDMRIALNEYNDTAVEAGDEVFYPPTRMLLVLDQDVTNIFRFDLTQAQYEPNSEIPVPLAIHLQVFTAPYMHNFLWNRNFENEIRFQYGMEDPNSMAFQILFELETGHQDFDQFTVEDVGNLSAEVRFTDALAVLLDVDLGELYALPDPTEEQINDLIDAGIHYQGEQIAEIEFSDEQNSFVVVYSDGSSDPLEYYANYLFDRIDEVFQDYTGSQPTFKRFPEVLPFLSP